MKKAASIILGATEYVFTLVLTSCFMMAVLRWTLNPSRPDFGMMLIAFISGLAMTVTFLSVYYYYRLFICQSLPLHIAGSIALAVVSTAITIPASELISRFLELPSRHVMGSW